MEPEPRKPVRAERPWLGKRHCVVDLRLSLDEYEEVEAVSEELDLPIKRVLALAWHVWRGRDEAEVLAGLRRR